MFLESKKISLIILAITSIVFSRVMFTLFDDPEGPNLLVVMVMATIVYLLSLITYKRIPEPSFKRFFLTIVTQAVIIVCFYFFLR